MHFKIITENGKPKCIFSLYDKRNDFNFDIIRFPHSASNIHISTLRQVAMAQILRVGRVNSNHAGFCRDLMQLYEAFRVRGLTVEDFLHCFKRNFVNKHYNYKQFKMEKAALYDKVVEYFHMTNL